MADPIRIGFIGCGLVARAHARGLSTVEDVMIGPVHDIDTDRAERFAAESGPSAEVVGDSAAVIVNCDAVYVCTWTAAHPPAVAAIAAAGKPVFCEKPLAVDLAAAEAGQRGLLATDLIAGLRACLNP